MELRPPGHLSFPDTPKGGREREELRGGTAGQSKPHHRAVASGAALRAYTRGLQSSRAEIERGRDRPRLDRRSVCMSARALALGAL